MPKPLKFSLICPVSDMDPGFGSSRFRGRQISPFPNIHCVSSGISWFVGKYEKPVPGNNNPGRSLRSGVSAQRDVVEVGYMVL